MASGSGDLTQRTATKVLAFRQDSKGTLPVTESVPFYFQITADTGFLLTHHLEVPVVASVVGNIDELVADRGHHVDDTLVTDQR